MYSAKRWVFIDVGLSPATEEATVKMGPPIEDRLESANLEYEQKEVLQYQDNAEDSTQSP